MSTPWSCSVYSSSSADEHNEDSCISSHDNCKIDVPSASRPLVYTITMSSGSSGANTFSSMSDSEGLLSSEPSTRAGTPPETPAAELRGRSLLSPPATFPRSISNELLMINPALFISSNSWRQDQGYEAETESSFSRLVLDSGVLSPLEESEHIEEHPLVVHSSLWERRTEAVRGRAPSTSGSSRSSRSREVLPNHDDWILRSSENEGAIKVTLISKPLLQRSRRPPPLNLSAVSSTQLRAQDKGVFDFDEDLSPNTPKRSFTAPLIAQINSDMKPELPHPPATAPFLTMPKAPLIRPCVLTFERSPSPLTLSSPCLSWSLDSASQPTTASTSSTLWSPTYSPSTSLPRGNNFMESRRRTLGRQIATLRVASASGPIPPSLRNSPVLSHFSSPRPATGSPLEFPVADFSFGTDPMSPPTHFIGTPFRRHMNPYFSDALTTNGKGVSRWAGEVSPPINPCNPYFEAAERPKAGCRD